MQIAEQFDNWLDIAQAILLSFLIKLGPFAVALMPALFTGYAIFATFQSEAGIAIALAFAIIVGLAMETVGIISTHTAIDLYNAWSENRIQAFKVLLMSILVPFYIAGVSGAVWYSEDAFTPLIKGLGIVSPFLTCIVYIAVALARDLIKIEKKSHVQVDEQKDEKHFARDKELLKLRMEHERELKRIEIEVAKMQLANTPIEQKEEKPRAKVQQFACEKCSSKFATIQALSAHGRHCKTALHVNGKSL